MLQHLKCQVGASIGAAMAALALSVAWAVPASAQSGAPIRIGYSMALTGGLAPFGKSALLAQKPYSEGPESSQKVFGRWSVKVKWVIDLIDLKPYFHGTASRSGAPCTLETGLP